MSNSGRIAALLLDAARLEREILEVTETGPESWSVRFEDADIELEHDADAGRLYLSTEAGIVKAIDRAAIYEAMLGYNLLWRDTGGVRLALTPDRKVFIVADLTLSELSAELLAAVLPNLITKARLWRAFVGTGGNPVERVDAFASFGIRV
jgi:hypothetical protein